MKKIVIGAIIAAIVAIIAWAVLQSSPNPEITWPSGVISTDVELIHDWGDINIQGGDVEHTFTLTNDSSDPLVIKTAETSCMCTTAYISVPEKSSSGRFGMHNNALNWNGIVQPGESFEVNVVFDPLAHGPTATGEIQRSVYITTSAVPDGDITEADKSVKDGSILEIKASGMVLSEEDYEKKQAETNASSSTSIQESESEEVFSVSELEYDFGVVKQSQGIITHDFELTYLGSEPITITGVPGSCACTTASVSNEYLETGDTTTLTVEFDPNLHDEPDGKFFKTIAVITDPEIDDAPEFKIWAEIDLDLGPEAYKLQEPHED